MVRFRFMALLIAVLLVVTACGSGGAEQPAAPTSAPAGDAATQAPQATAAGGAQPTTAGQEAGADQPVDSSKLSQELHVYNWADYIDPAVLDDFEQEYGVKVTVEVYDNNEDMIAKVRPGNSGYDIVVPSDYAVDIMIQEKLLAPIDKTLLPNLKNVKPENLDLYYDKGNVYSVPYNYGLTGIAYNKSKFPTPPDSWAVLFDPAQLTAFQGEASMLDDEREVPGAALKFIGKSLNDTDQAALKQVEEILKAQKPLLAAYDSSNYSRRLASGEIVLAQAYNNGALQARIGLEGDYSGNPDIGFVIPKEGGTIWQDNMCILADSPNSYTAHVFINYLQRPDVAAKNNAFLLGLTPNAEAEKLLPADMQALYQEGFGPNEETYQRLEWIERNEGSAAFTDLWTAVKGE